MAAGREACSDSTSWQVFRRLVSTELHNKIAIPLWLSHDNKSFDFVIGKIKSTFHEPHTGTCNNASISWLLATQIWGRRKESPVTFLLFSL